MKFGITRYELFALTSHLVGKPSPNPEHGRKRLRAWDELGVAELADSLTTMASGFPAEIRTADWADREKPMLVDINADVLDFLINGCSLEASGLWADRITRLRGRLEALRDKKYTLPDELLGQENE
jgi:hypothetical protein